MTKMTATALVVVAVGIGLLANFDSHAQTPQQTWSTLLGDKQADLQPNRIRIEYEQPESAELQPVYWVMMRRRPLQRVREIFSPVRLPVELTVRMKECGVSNAWYQRPTITLCYEYIREMQQMAPKETSENGITPVDAVVGQFLFTASHEMGHAVFDLLNVPLFGPPEADADQFAAHTLVTIGKRDATRLIEGAAYMYKNYWGNPSVTAPTTAFADVHGPPMQRMYALTCLAYGSDPDLFSYVVEKNYLPQARARGCRREWGEVDYAFQQLIYPFYDQKLADDVLSKSWVPRRSAPPRTTDLPQSARQPAQ